MLAFARLPSCRRNCRSLRRDDQPVRTHPWESLDSVDLQRGEVNLAASIDHEGTARPTVPALRPFCLRASDRSCFRLWPLHVLQADRSSIRRHRRGRPDLARCLGYAATPMKQEERRPGPVCTAAFVLLALRFLLTFPPFANFCERTGSSWREEVRPTRDERSSLRFVHFLILSL